MNNRKKILLLLVFVILCSTATFGQKYKQIKFPYYDWGTCPFECCTYRTWQATKTTNVYAKRTSGGRVRFKVRKGEKVRGLTGVVVISKPGVAIALRTAPIELSTNEHGNEKWIPRGEKFYLLTYLGEGYFRMWHRGVFFVGTIYGNSNFKILSEQNGTWWVKIRNRRKQVGWTKQSGNFDNQDACS